MERLGDGREGAQSMGVLGTVVSVEGGVASGMTKWCSKGELLACFIVAFLMRWETSHDPGTDLNLTTTDAPSTSSFSEFQREKVGSGLIFPLI